MAAYDVSPSLLSIGFGLRLKLSRVPGAQALHVCHPYGYGRLAPNCLQSPFDVLPDAKIAAVFLWEVIQYVLTYAAEPHLAAALRVPYARRTIDLSTMD